MSSQTGNTIAPESIPGPPVGMFGRLFGSVPAVLVLASLAGVAYWGHQTEWKFTHRHDTENAETIPEPAGLAVVRRHLAGPESSPLPGITGEVSIEFQSAEAVEKAGIDIAPVWRTAMTEDIGASGEVMFDSTLVARLSPRASGTAWWVAKTAGDTVRAGETLALIDAADVGKAKAEFQQALVQARLKRQALANLGTAQGVVPARQRREAEAALREAETRLLAAEQALTNLGIPARATEFDNLTLEQVVRRMRTLGVNDLPGTTESGNFTANLLPARSPIEGVVLTSDVVAGEVVDAGKVLFVVVDPRRLSLTLHIGLDSIVKVKMGQPVEFRPDGTSDLFKGQVTWVGTAADETTRTIPVRVELANEAGKLRASTLGKGRILLRTDPKATVVPREAVRMFRGVPVVFARHPDYLKSDGPKSFEARPVRVGATDNQNAEILSGLRTGEVVATKGAEVLLDNLSRVAPK